MPSENRPSSLLRARYRRLPRRSASICQGGILRMPVWIESPTGGPPSRPWGAIWVAGPAGLVNAKIADAPGVPTAGFAADALAELILRYQDHLAGRPAVLQVVDESLGHAIAEELGDPELRVDVVSALPHVTAAIRSLEAYEREGPPVPSLLDDPGIAVEDVRRFADAARRFCLAEPWQHLTDQDVIEIEQLKGHPGLRCCAVMGNAGIQYGIAFYPTIGAHADMAASAFESQGSRHYWSVSFETPDNLPFADHDLWLDHHLPLASEDRYPLPVALSPVAPVSRPTRAQLGFFEAVFSALAETTEGDIDQGRWTKTVSTSGKPVRVQLALPDVLHPDDAKTTEGLVGDRRAAERLHAEVARFLREGHFQSLEEANAAVQQEFVGKRPDETSTRASTPEQRAQDVAYRASDAVGRRRVILAREALAIWPDCADAYVVLAEQAAGPERALPLYQQGVDAGRRTLGDDGFEGKVGHFWSILETRPYMRARLGVAQSLKELGRVDEALPHYRDLLRLNPADNQGARYLLLHLYMEAGRDADAASLIAQYEHDVMAEWAYGRVLLSIRQGNTSQAAADLAIARKFNPHVPGYLLFEDADPPEMDDRGLRIGGRDEAWEYAEVWGDMWSATPGAVDWLRRQERDKRGSRRKANRGRQKPRGRQGGARRRR